MHKVIRDVIHGDITIEEKFLKVVDTKEFQRLHRIKQLSVADMIFPGATHSRFSHCIGTYHVMSLCVQHFQTSLKEEGDFEEFSEDEVNPILLAALLHDLGHASFSHAFEVVSKRFGIGKTHEEWTCELITSESTEIHEVIMREFGNDMPQKVVEVIKHQQSVKKQPNSSFRNIDLLHILSSLISSQLDADRMDYLLRDSFFCGVKVGNIDIQRIISALQLTVKDNNFFVCVPEKFVPDIEAYVLARYQMSKIVYYHDLKLCYENLIVKILSRAKELYKNNKLNDIPLFFKCFFDNKLSVDNYIELDDVSIISQFQIWKNLDDDILKNLCIQFLYRRNLSKANILDNSSEKLEDFKSKLKDLFSPYGYDVNDFQNEYFWSEGKKEFSAYSVKKENIWVLKNNGIIEDFTKISRLFTELVNTDNSGKILMNNENAVYINYPLIHYLPVEKTKEVENSIRKLVEQYDVRNNIEIEKKYIVKNKCIFRDIEEFFKNEGFSISKKQKKQTDIYFDTDDYQLLKNKITTRIRKIKNKNEMTVKFPVKTDSENIESERFEYKKNLGNKEEIDHEFFAERVKKLKLNINSKLLKRSLIVCNERIAMTVQKNSVIFEIAFDTVKYVVPKNPNDCEKENQIEIELKSSYQHRVNLQILSSKLEKNLDNKLEITTDSKYKRGLSCFGIKVENNN